jgi:integrase
LQGTRSELVHLLVKRLAVLKWADVDLDAGKLSVRRCLKVTEDGLDFGPPTNKASRRSVPRNKTAVAALWNTGG